MKIYWTIYSIPELQHLPSKQAKYEAYLRCWFRALKNWRGWAAILGFCLLGGGGIYAVHFLIPRSVAEPVSDVAGFLVAIISSGIFGQIMTSTVRYFLRKEIE